MDKTTLILVFLLIILSAFGVLDTGFTVRKHEQRIEQLEQRVEILENEKQTNITRE